MRLAPLTRVALAAPHPAAVAAGERAVRAGGNALDAALAAAAALVVVYPHQCSLGGDLVALVRDERRGARVTSVVSAGTLPRELDLAALAGAPMPRRGPATVTVPGVVAGWSALALLGAALPLGSALAGAARLAASAPAISPGLARAAVVQHEAVFADPGLRGVLAPRGRLLAAGERLDQPALAATLVALADDPDSFYRGPLAHDLVAGLRRLGGLHRAEDLAAHTAEVGEALECDAGGVRWWVAPPPSQGALLLGVAPAAATARALGAPTPLVAAGLRAMDVRDRELGDPRTGAIDVDALTGLCARGSTPAPPTGRALGDTVAVTAVDDQGLSVSLIQSVFATFGAGLLEPSTGIVLHNRGASFSTDPHSPARAVHGSRPPHTLCPLLLESDEVMAAVGCQGGRAQPWILAQTALDLARADTDPTAVLARPRWVVGAHDLGHEVPTLVVEPGAEGVAGLGAELGVPIAHLDGPHDDAGHVQVARRHRADGRLCAASDPRADGRGEVLGLTPGPPTTRTPDRSNQL